MSKATMLQYLLSDYSQYSNNLLTRIKTTISNLTPNPLQPTVLYYKNHSFKANHKAVISITSLCTPDQLKDLYALCDSFIKEESNLDYIRWYLIRLISEADSINTIKQCIPEYLHSKIEYMEYTGTKSYSDLFIQDCYDSLEQSILMNTLLRNA